MAKMIFVLQRRAGLTREQALAQWSGEQHVAIVGKLPGLTRYVQNHVGSAPAEPVCDGIGELWFATDDLMNQALNSPEMAAAVEDAKRFLDMERTGMILVQEKILVGLAAHPPATGGNMRVTGMSGDHADAHLAHLSGLAGPGVPDATALTVRRGTPRRRCHPGPDNAPSTQMTLIWATSVLIALQPTSALEITAGTRFAFYPGPWPVRGSAGPRPASRPRRFPDDGQPRV
jgi:uncharacterized protein (TIGR02118 family)